MSLESGVSCIGSQVEIEKTLSSCEDFFQSSPPPNDLSEVREKAKQFIEGHQKNHRLVVLVTSGGTTVPLEKNTVRSINNFSSGTRGSRSAEYFLASNYAVLFLYHSSSLQPFHRHFSADNPLDWLSLSKEEEKTVLKFSGMSNLEERFLQVLPKYQRTKEEGTLLSLPYTTVFQYLFYLRELTLLLRPLESRAMVYLAAAVSDFYVPQSCMPDHKIPSSSQLKLDFSHVPKMLFPLTFQWIPRAFTVTFKLETDEKVILQNAKAALSKYRHQVVVANLLETRHATVTIVTKTSATCKDDLDRCGKGVPGGCGQDDSPEWEALKLQLCREDISRGTELECLIISDLVARHQNYISSET